ncbi:MAG: 7-cyano-7-deazaguanine synthase QueC [Nitrososphaerota archaeon]|nr:7-cyano-7-deazaguanine synthase QueC [Nitrososphaerota archaeon]
MRSIILLSGGIDSATALYSSLKESDEVLALTFDYEIGRSKEIEAAKRIAESAGILHRLVELPFYKSLKGSPSSTSKKLGKEEGGLSPAYVPARNLVFFGVAAAHAETYGAGEIITGHIKGDSSRFPDVGNGFVSAMNTLLGSTSGVGRVVPVIRMPLLGKTKEKVLEEAIRLNVPLERTWSCYNNADEPCGVCYGCESRRDAFRRIGVEDPWGKKK